VNGNGKTLWIAVIGVMLTVAGAIYQGGQTVGQVRENIDSIEQRLETTQRYQKKIADLIAQQARGRSERDALEDQISRLRQQIDDLQDGDTGPHQQTTGDTDG